MHGPAGIAVDNWGDIMIADWQDNKIREIVASSGSPLQVQSAGIGITLNGTSGAQTSFYPVSTAFSVTAATWSSGIATITAANSVSPGGTVTVSGVLPSGYNGTYTVQASSASWFTVPITTNPGAFTSGGTAAGCAGPTVTATALTGDYCTLPEDRGTLVPIGSNYVFTDSSNNTFTFDSSGEFSSEKDLAGNTLSVTYSSPAVGTGYCPSGSFYCNTVTSASGRTFVVAVDSIDHVSRVTDPTGRYWQYGYTGDQLTSATDPMNGVTSYGYQAGTAGTPGFANDLATVTAPNGQSGGPDAGKHESITYDAFGRVASQTDPLGNATTLSYLNMNQAMGTGTVMATDPESNNTDYGFDHGALSSQKVWNTTNVTGASYAGTTATVSFGVKDASGTSLVAGMVPAVGSTITVAGVTPAAYNGTFTVTASAPGSVSYTGSGLSAYSSGGTVNASAESDFGPDLSTGTLLNAWTSDEDGNQTSYVYDSNGNGNVTSTTDPLNHTDTNSYDANTNAETSAATSMATTDCIHASPPSAVPAGGVITPPSATPPQGDDYSLVDTDGNTLYTTTGVYEPGSSTAFQSTAGYTRTNYTLYKGNSVTLRAWGPGQSGYSTQSVGCGSVPPSQSVPCATIDENGIVTQFGYDT
jgi:YD repeat-containing protein